MATDTSSGRYDINSLKRALKILELLAEDGKALGVTELSRKLEVDKSMVHRLLSTLAGSGYVEQDGESRKYVLGLKVIELAGIKLNSVELISVAKPYLKELAKLTGESAHLAAMADREIIYLDKEEGSSALTTRGGIGLKCPPHSSAVGKVLLAFMADEDVIEVIRHHGLPRFTRSTIVSLSELKEHLLQVRKSGYGMDDEETYVGVRCIAAPLRDHRGRVVASMGVSGPAQQITEDRLRFLCEVVIDTAGRASSRLGYPSSSQARAV